MDGQSSAQGGFDLSKLPAGMDEAAIQRSYMLGIGAMMLLLTLLGAVATILVGYISARVASGISRDLRRAVFTKVEGFSLHEFDTFSTASLITRTNNDVMQGHEEERFDKANKDLTGNLLFVNRVMVVMMPVMMLIMNGVSLIIIWVGAHQVAQASMQVGDMMAFMQYAMQIFFAFIMMSMMFIMLPRAQVSANRIAEVLETEASVKDPASPRAFAPAAQMGIEFRDLSFRYPGAEEDVLHGISFTARPGQTTAIIGATGSGKSSVVGLVPRFYDATDGSVLVGGIDVRELSQVELREKIGFVPQKANLFSGTIGSNLRYADEEASEEALEGAARIAQAAEFIAESPEGLARTISQGGANVSGGQKQRLSIARALVKRPPIYIFDDSFSALDFKTDSALRRALKKETGDATVIIVTQRVATVKAADQIVVLDDGRVVGIGSHESLMGSCETYQEIATSQLSEEELR